MDDNLTTGSASIAGMDVSITNDGGSSTWSLGTTVSGVDLTLASSKAFLQHLVLLATQ